MSAIQQASWFSRYVTISNIFSMVISAISSFIVKQIYEKDYNLVVPIYILLIFVGLYLIVYLVSNLPSIAQWLTNKSSGSASVKN